MARCVTFNHLRNGFFKKFLNSTRWCVHLVMGTKINYYNYLRSWRLVRDRGWVHQEVRHEERVTMNLSGSRILG